MPAFWKIFISIFCYIAAVSGLVLGLINASQKPPVTSWAIAFCSFGVFFGICGVYLTRRPHY
jgi:hypothetical protein